MSYAVTVRPSFKSEMSTQLDQEATVQDEAMLVEWLASVDVQLDDVAEVVANYQSTIIEAASNARLDAVGRCRFKRPSGSVSFFLL